jgi:aspartate carbamoyltransferase catalytic subunit
MLTMEAIPSTHRSSARLCCLGRQVLRRHHSRTPAVASAWKDSKLRHVIDSRDFSLACLNLVFDTAEQMERVKPGTPESKQLEGYTMATLFYEPSTRTRLSFEAAMGKLGGIILSTESAGQFSSAAKGETLEGKQCAV